MHCTNKIAQPKAMVGKMHGTNEVQRLLDLTRLLIFLGAGIVGVVGCSTTPYKDDIATFKTSVDKATLAFDTLEKNVAEADKLGQAEEVAASRPVIVVASQCSGPTNYADQQIRSDVDCLAEWASYRSKPVESRGRAPSCPGAQPSIRAGKDEFYDLDALRKKEEEACKIGVARDGAVDVTAFDTKPTSIETLRLSKSLRAYATALSDIASADDREALADSVAKAKASLEKMTKDAEAEQGNKIGNATLVGPVTEITGSFLVAALERRRLKALQVVTKAADDVVGLAAVLIANTSVGLTQFQLIEAKRIFTGPSLPGAGVIEDESKWLASYAAANAARDKYLAVYEQSPIHALEAMAKAHKQLTVSLADPKKQYEAVAKAILDFAEKAQALQDAYDALAEEKAKTNKKGQEAK